MHISFMVPQYYEEFIVANEEVDKHLGYFGEVCNNCSY